MSTFNLKPILIKNFKKVNNVAVLAVIITYFLRLHICHKKELIIMYIIHYYHYIIIFIYYETYRASGLSRSSIIILLLLAIIMEAFIDLSALNYYYKFII